MFGPLPQPPERVGALREPGADTWDLFRAPLRYPLRTLQQQQDRACGRGCAGPERGHQLPKVTHLSDEPLSGCPSGPQFPRPPVMRGVAAAWIRGPYKAWV